MESQNTNYKLINSLSDKKFVYFNSEEIKNFCILIFDANSSLSNTKNENISVSFFEHVKKGVTLDDYHEYQRKQIELLIDKKILLINLCNQLIFKKNTVINIYFLIWNKGYLSTLYMNKNQRDIVDIEVNNNNLKYGNTLFSSQESDYISFIMDNKNFSNGLAIRNKITHGNYGKKKNNNYKIYYLELLKILLLFSVRINEELDTYFLKK